MHIKSALAFTLSFIAFSLGAQTPSTPSPPSPTAKYDRVIRTNLKPDQPGAAYIVVKDGNVVFRGATGMANLAAARALNADDVFRIGSVTKQFTAVAILLLVDEGKLKLDDDITAVLPALMGQSVAKGKGVTIRHLLTHTSGLVNYTSLPTYSSNLTKRVTTTELVARFKDLPLEFEPGTKWAYCNSGYALLGAAIEARSGKSYGEFLATRILIPLGMTNTALEGLERSNKKRVEGYALSDGKEAPDVPIDISQVGAAGGIVSTVDDMAKWAAAIEAKKLLKPETWATAFTAFTLRSGEKTNYALGWATGMLQGFNQISHGGGINGFSSYAMHVPSERVYVAVLSNTTSGNGSHVGVAQRLAAIAVGKPMIEYDETKISTAQFDRLSGQYQIAPNLALNIFRDGGKFFAQVTGQGAFEVFAESDTRLFARVADIRIDFYAGPDGAIVNAMIKQGTRETGAKRVAAAKAKTEVKLANADLDAIAGEYELAPGMILRVRIDGGNAKAQLTGQGEIEIYPQARDEFFYRIVEATLKFTRDASGKVVSVTLFQNGREVPGKKIK